MKSGIGNLLKQAQKMQEELARTQERLAQEEVMGESGGGMVRVTMNGRHEVKRVAIDPALLGDDKEMLEDLVAERMQQNMADLTAGMPLPPGFKLPF